MEITNAGVVLTTNSAGQTVEAQPVLNLDSPYVLSGITRNAKRMLWGQGIRAPQQEITVSNGEEYEVSRHWYLSPPWWTRNPRLGFANWYLTNSTSAPEVSASNSQLYPSVSFQVGRDGTPAQLKVGGQSSFTIAAGNGAVTDTPANIIIPPNTWCAVRICRYNAAGAKRVIDSFARARGVSIGDRSQVSASDISASVMDGTDSSDFTANSQWAPGPALIEAEGWDGVTPIGLIFGTSIEYGQGEAPRYRDKYGEMGPVGRGFAKPAHNSPRIPNVNWSIPGGYAQAFAANGSTLAKRKALIDALGLSYLPFTFIYCGGWTNDSAAFVTWITYIGNVHTALKTLWPTAKLIQATMWPRTQSSDGFTTVAGQSAQSASWTLLTGDAWNVRSWMLNIPNTLPNMDVCFDVMDAADKVFAGGSRGKWWLDLSDQWSSTLQAACNSGSKNMVSALLFNAVAGEIIGFTGGAPEANIVVSTSGTASPFSATLYNNMATTHNSAETIKKAIISDGTHPSVALNDRLADDLFIPAKRAGIFN
jgi:hypothetical protein